MNEKKRLHLETQRNIAEINRKHEILLDAIKLYYLLPASPHAYDISAFDELVRKYDISDEEIWWLYNTALRDYDIDLGDWLDYITWKDIS